LSVEEIASKIIDKLFVLPPEPYYSRASGNHVGHQMPLSYDMALNVMIDAVLRKDEETDKTNTAAIIHWNKVDRSTGVLPPVNILPIWPEFKRLFYDVLGYDFYISEPPTEPSTAGRQIHYNIGDTSLSLHNLSDGEKQIMLMIVLMFVNTNQKFVVIVDEPELHLNEQKAIDIWSQVEKNLPKSLFIYATHNVAFATRSEVEILYFMRMDGELEWMDLDAPLPSHALKEIVGSRVQILRTDKPVIFCEDELSKNIISDIFASDDYAVISVGGKDGVIRGARPDDVWNNLIAGDRKCCGIIDRDARQTDQVETLSKKNSFCLPVNETESLLLHPDIILFLLKNINPQSNITEETYAKIVCGCARSVIDASLETLQGYIVNKTRIRIAYNQTSSGIEVDELLGLNQIKSDFTVYANHLLNAIKNYDLNTVLLLSCGKEVFERVARDSAAKIGMSIDPDPIRFYNMIRDKPLVLERIRNIHGMDKVIKNVHLTLS